MLRKQSTKQPPLKPTKNEFWDAAGQSEIGWHMSDRARLDHFGKYRFTEWDTKLLFDQGKMVEINVSCDGTPQQRVGEAQDAGLEHLATFVADIVEQYRQ